jgi:hypothetical protein
MFISLICLLHLQAMFNYEMDLISYFTCLHVLELLLFIAAIITYGIYLSYMSVLFGIRIFNLFKSEGSMTLISLNLQQRQIKKRQRSYAAACTAAFWQRVLWLFVNSDGNVVPSALSPDRQSPRWRKNVCGDPATERMSEQRWTVSTL